MSRLSRWTAALLAVCILTNLIPVSSVAQTEVTASTETILSQSGESLVPPEETAGTTAPTVGETQPMEEETAPTEEEITSTEEEITSTGEETIPTEEETQPAETEEQSLRIAETNVVSSAYIDFSVKYFANVLRSNGYSEEDIGNILKEEESGITLKIAEGQEAVLALLSQTTQGAVILGEESGTFDYSQWTLKCFEDKTGDISLPDNFVGLGDPDYPFAGILYGQGVTLVTKMTLFKALDAKVQLDGMHEKRIRWIGPSGRAILAEILYVDNDSHVIKMPLVGSDTFSPYIGRLQPKSGVITPGEITLPALNYTPRSEGTSETPIFSGSAGLLCGIMVENTKLKFDSTLKLPDNIPVSISSEGDVGALVGKMESGAQLTFSTSTSTPTTLISNLNGENAGGLVGSMDANATLTISSPLTLTTTLTGSKNAGGLAGSLAARANIQLDANVTIAKAGTDAEPIYNTITATNSAGGIVGEMTTVTGSVIVSEGFTISLTDTESKVIGGTNAGGLYGSCSASGDLDPFTGVTIVNRTITVGGNGSCGGLFGVLTLGGDNNKCTIENKTLYAKLCSASTTTRFGGIVGTLIGSRKNALVVGNQDPISASTTPHITTNTKYGDNVLKPQYLGGLVAYQNATLDVTNVCVKLADASQTAGETYYTGGLSAYVCDDMLLMADNLRIIFNGYTGDDHNGGVAGYTGKGSIVYLKEQLLLKDCPLQSVKGCGQIVATQDCSLVYGPGVTITRWGQGMEVDDIGSYGEMYRVEGLLEINDDYSHVLKRTLTAQEDIYTLSDKLDYACLALAWQSRGEFDTVSGINDTNWQKLQSCEIKLGKSIDLTGMGIGGLSRDVYSADDVFRGTFDGNDKTLKLDIGAKNAQDNTSSGDGRIYFHNSTGLFAGLSSNATVNNLTLDGSIRVSNNRLNVNTDDQSANMKTGALAGLFLCEGGENNINYVSTTVSITANSNTITPNAPFYIGGLFGLAYGASDTKLTLNGNLGATISHEITESSTVSIIGQCFHTGGAIGAVDAGCTQLKIECNGAVISGQIERTGSVADNFYAGGLVGTIFPNESSNRTITLTDLKVGQKPVGEDPAKSFTLSGSAELRMGGVLGGIWADTDVIVSGLKVENANLTATGKAKLGGLVYRASGKWTISSADLSGLTISADSAEGLGLMVCQGGPYQEPLGYNKSDAANIGTYKEIGGLYLVMTEYWTWENNKGYNVPTNITFSGDVFDEFVAYTAYAYFTDANKNAPPYSITSNGSGIISLRTATESEDETPTVSMTGTASDCNTYENRTNVAKKTNLYSRYYYNLPEVKEACNTEDSERIDTPQELLIWSVNRYAAENLKADKREDFRINGIDTSDIGGSSDSSRADFNMEGLSYYPIRIIDSSITVQYADVKFHNQQIEKQVSDNKSTRGSADDHTQHYTMHCGLFLDFVAEAKEYTEIKNYTMIVNGVTFAGTVGKVNGQSGALLCGTVSGKFSGKAATCTVTLADSDNSTKAVTLNGVAVDSTDVYKPVLIGKIWEYATLQANYVTTSEKQKSVAGSSLIGDVGHSAATGLAITFAGTIKLPSENTSVFTSATLLNSLRYQGSTPATYQFVKGKDWVGDSHIYDVTYGFEISGSVEYVDEQLEYFDGGYVSSNIATATEPMDFSSYLPYVAHSPARDDGDTYTVENGYHELEVNVKPANLLQGCGTYGDPYVLDSEKLLKSVAKYLEHPEKTINGWQIRYPASENYHTNGSSDITLTFNSTTQTWSDNSSVDTIRKHLSNAYYVIEKDMRLVSFSGLGTEDYPFSGVIQGKDESTKNITLSGTSQALIQYSNGSVVRNLNISLAQNAPLRSSAPEMINGQRTANRAPKYFFGGVIGCVLGGDNIIENVIVSVPTGKTPYNFPDGYTSYEHLVPIGGYVGVIAGGGVVFRGSISSNTGITGTDKQLYRNPIVGRVLGGYAFYEGEAKNAPNNTDKNYKINTITSSNHLSWSDNTLTVKDAEGMLLLSAIVSSGAGSYGHSLAYKTGYGVARVAMYDQIGAANEPTDYAIANNYTTPYLLYRENITAKLCQSGDQSGITLKLDDDLDMSGYGSGYRGLSARYVSNAGFTANDNGITQLSPYTAVMRIKSFDGNKKTVSGINMDVREYDDDDFHVASMGGIFNIVWTNKDTGGTANSTFAQNLTLENCTVKLEYIDKNGGKVCQAQTEYFTQTDGISTVAVGGFIGTVNNLSTEGMGSKKSNYLFKRICVTATDGKHSTIYGPNSAGAIIGASGMGSTGNPGKLLTNGATSASNVKFGPSFLNCSYKNTDVTGYLAAGGMVGCAATGYDNLTSFGTSQDGENAGCFATCTITDDDLIFAENSTVQTLSSGGICGGVFGGIGMRGRINEPGTKDNQPMVNYLTGLPIIGTDDLVCTLRFKNVKFYADIAFNQHITYTTSGTINGVDNGKTIAVGGCIGRISHANPVRIYQVQMGNADVLEEERCKIQVTQTSKTAPSTPDVSEQYAGGLVGYGYTTKEMKIQDCAVYCTDISGATAGGFVSLARLSALNVSDCILQDCTVDCTTRAGGITGSSEGSVNLFNILLKETPITKNGVKNNTNVARLVVQTTSKEIKAAGIAVFAKGGTVLPDSDISGAYTGYVAYADYLAEQTAKPTGSKAPYVTVNPSYSLPLTDSKTKTLIGDAVKISGSYGSIAEQIWIENSTSAPQSKGNYASYPAAENPKITKPTISTFNAALGEGPENLPVLLVKGGDAKAITDYLDIITNGGYTAAAKDTVDKVTFDTTVYYLNEEKTAFSTENWDTEHTGDPSVTTTDNGKKLVVSGTSYDNTRHRFTLVQATFQTDLGEYTVSIPVVVQRKLEYVYMATFSYGTEFHAETYQDIKNHLLESTGVPFSAYLTFQYNQSYNNNQVESAEYDWKSYIESGGDLIAMDKTLKFTGGFPKGTQFTLVDCQHGNRAYYYCDKNNETQELLLSSFLKNPKDDSTGFSFSMADVLGITCAETANPNGAFTKLPNRTEEATLLINGEYFRRAKDGDDKDSRFDLIYPENLSTVKAEEHYYLVITVPQQSAGFARNGKLEIGVKDYGIPTNGTKIHRNDNTEMDDGNTTESTYNISSGYQQVLTTSNPKSPVNLNDGNNKMHIAVTDTITFSSDQAYSTKDLLFLKFTASLTQHKNDAETEDRGIPAGTTGTVLFYVQDTAGDYYVRNGDQWSRLAPPNDPENIPDGYQACSYDWTSDGGSLSLPLSQDGKTPLDLSGVRSLIKNKQGVEPKIIVKAVMEKDISLLSIGEGDPIPLSKDGMDAWANLHYVAQLSTQARSLDYSTVRAMGNDDTRYFRLTSYQAILTMDALKIRQLGVNPLAPVEDDLTADRAHSIIQLNVALNLAELEERKRILENTQQIVFTLSLERRNDGVANVRSYEIVGEEERNNFISFRWKDDVTGWRFYVSKNDQGNFDYGFDVNETLFQFPLTAYVAMNQTQYANYQIKMDVEFLDSEGRQILTDVYKNTSDAYVVYTYACIKPSFYEPKP